MARQLLPEENGTSVLDGILPAKDSSSNNSSVKLEGKLDEEGIRLNNDNPPAKGGMLAHLLEKKDDGDSKNSVMVNGGLENNGKPDFKKMNGDSAVISTAGFKRSADAAMDEATPAKAMMMETNTNGIDEVKKEAVVATPNQPQQVVLRQQQQIVVTTASVVAPVGQAVQAGIGGGSPMVLAQTTGHPSGAATPAANKFVILQPQNKVVTTTGQVVRTLAQAASTTTTITNGQIVNQVVNPPGQPITPVANGQMRVNGVPQQQGGQPSPGGGLVSPSSVSSATSSSGLSPNSLPPPSAASPAAGAATSNNHASSTNNIPSNPSPAPAAAQAAPVVGRAAPAAAQAAAAAAVAAASATAASAPRSGTTQHPFLCEWQNCSRAFRTPKEVENHAIKIHCPENQTDIPCMWSRCDGMKRKRFSLMTHIQDRHCHPQVNKLF